MTNHLKTESSPYLLQHVENPVEWYPWGFEAFERARLENKPVLLSIGYSACHWCHVMAHESFENPAIASLMNKLFINIKVDREERPDLDAIYMAAVQAMAGQGGWPLTAFLTPDAKPFYGGTYFPPDDRRGMPGFPRVLEHVAEAYQERRPELAAMTEDLLLRIQALQVAPPRPEALQEATLETAVNDLAKRYDPVWGGFGQAPKFPPSMSLELLFRRFHRFGDKTALAMAEKTLARMAQGGMYDQIGGGFHRYSVDARWHVPHFEKMLYDNALLARIYLLAFQITQNPWYRQVAIETLDYITREMTSPEGGFYASQDADSEGEEGAYFVWSHQEIQALLGAADGPLFAACFDVTEKGNFEGSNVLWRPLALSEVAEKLHVGQERLAQAVTAGRKKLFEARDKRIKPATDSKILTSWNGLMLKSFALAFKVIGRKEYLEVAERNADFLLRELWANGRLLRTHKDGLSKLNGYLEDYAHLIDGLVSLYEATFAPKWLQAALELLDVANDEFWDEGTQAFFDTGKTHETLVIRPRDAFDNAMPSGQSVMADVLSRLAHLTSNDTFRTRALAVLTSAGALMTRYPAGMSRMLTALDFTLAPVQEVALVGESDSKGWAALETELFASYHPYAVVAGRKTETAERFDLPLLRNRTAPQAQALAFVCQAHTCQAPISDPAALRQALRVRQEDL
jgi:uncharacterized protein YyaL (SSP411 family)